MTNIHLATCRIVSTGFGSGLIPGPRGTWGSLAFLALWYALSRTGINIASWPVHALVVLLVAFAGFCCVRDLVITLPPPPPGKKMDPSFIVVDEWLGMAIALSGIDSRCPWMIVASFVLFRLLDATKPGIIRRAEHFPGAYGIMLDDIAAGVAACVLCHAGFFLFSLF